MSGGSGVCVGLRQFSMRPRQWVEISPIWLADLLRPRPGKATTSPYSTVSLPSHPPSWILLPRGPVLSARRLETVGCCPLRYFFRYVLDIAPPEELTVDLTRWLDPLEFGNLLHDVFYRFMSELITERRLPLYERDSPKLFKILDEMVARYERLYPPTGPSAFRQQILQLIRTAQIFLVEEEELCRHSKPLFLEASVGMPSYERSSPLDALEPVAIPLPSGKTVRHADDSTVWIVLTMGPSRCSRFGIIRPEDQHDTRNRTISGKVG